MTLSHRKGTNEICANVLSKLRAQTGSFQHSAASEDQRRSHRLGVFSVHVGCTSVLVNKTLQKEFFGQESTPVFASFSGGSTQISPPTTVVIHTQGIDFQQFSKWRIRAHHSTNKNGQRKCYLQESLLPKSYICTKITTLSESASIHAFPTARLGLRAASWPLVLRLAVSCRDRRPFVSNDSVPAGFLRQLQRLVWVWFWHQQNKCPTWVKSLVDHHLRRMWLVIHSSPWYKLKRQQMWRNKRDMPFLFRPEETVDMPHDTSVVL